MIRLKVILVGLGDFGIGWYREVLKHEGLTLAAVVDSNIDTHSKADAQVPCYTCLAAALEDTTPDFIINATPPHAHLAINRLAFSRNIPVLMEKPISEDYAEVLEMLEYAKNGQKLMVAENYRYSPQNMFVKEQIRSRLQSISGVNLVFRQHHHVSAGNYHNTMQHPAIVDIGVHHIDLLRFFTGREVRRVYAQLSTPAWSWYGSASNVKMVAEMQGGIQFCYDLAMDARAVTGWSGDWTFTAQNGVARYTKDKLRFDLEDGIIELELPTSTHKSDKHRMLDDFILYVRNGVVPQVDITDQVKNAAAAEAAIQSAKTGRAVDVDIIGRAQAP